MKQRYKMILICQLEPILSRIKLDIFGKDSLMNSFFQYNLLSIIYATLIIVRIPNPCIYFALIYAVIPLLDELFTLDTKNPNNQESYKL